MENSKTPKNALAGLKKTPRRREIQSVCIHYLTFSQLTKLQDDDDDDDNNNSNNNDNDDDDDDDTSSKEKYMILATTMMKAAKQSGRNFLFIGNKRLIL